MFNRVHALLGLLAVAGASAGASAAPVEAVYLHMAVAPSPSVWSAAPASVVGIADPRVLGFGNLTRTSDGQKWVTLLATNVTPNTQDQILFVGSGPGTGMNLGQEAVTKISVSPDPDEFLNFGASVTIPPRVNAAGQWAVGYRLAVTGATNIDDRLAVWNGTSFVVTKPGDAIPALPGSVYNGSFGSAFITDSGQATFLALISPNTSASSDCAFTANGATQQVEIGVSTPSGQGTMTAVPWNDIDANFFQTDGAGTSWIALGEVGTTTATDKVAVVNGVVKAQEGFAVPGVPGVVTAISSVRMEANGDWFVRGTSTGSIAWWMRNGVIIAMTGQPITPSSTELWGGTLREARGDNSGNYIVSGTTNNADTLINDVVVYNGSKVLVRKSDPLVVDVNGDMVNETFYLHTLQDRCVLLNDDYFYMTNQLKATATDTGTLNGNNNHNLVRIRVCRADFNADAVVSIDDLFLYFNAYFTGAQRADMNGVGGVTIDDLFLYINFYFTGC